MNSETRKTRILHLGLSALAALALSATPALFNVSRALAQDGYAGDQMQSGEPRQDPPAPAVSDDPNSVDSQTAAAQAATNDAAAKLDEATQNRDELVSEGAPEDQINAANQAIAQARAQREIAQQALRTLGASRAVSSGEQDQ
jgi:HAMP domain-containing protein